MKNVSIVFCNPKAWWKQIGSAIIRWGDKSEASHCAIVVDNTWVYESVFPRSRKLPVQEWLQIYQPKKTFHLQVSDIEKSYEVLDSLLDRYYSIGQLFLILITNTFTWADRLLNFKVINHEKGLICTEIVSRYLEAMGKIKVTESHDKIGVLDLYEYCKKWLS